MHRPAAGSCIVRQRVNVVLTRTLAVAYTRFAADKNGVRGSGSVVEHLLAKEKVAGSNPVFRSRNHNQTIA